MEVFQTDVSLLNINSRDLIFLYKNDTIIKAMEVFNEKKISTLPIIEENNNLYGMLYLKDLIFLFNNNEKFCVITLY